MLRPLPQVKDRKCARAGPGYPSETRAIKPQKP
jgi:hypothetical protein